VGHSTLVPKCPKDLCRQPILLVPVQESIIPTNRLNSGTSSTPQTYAHGIESIRSRLSSQQISRRTSNVILQSWRSGTHKQYEVHIKKWKKFCGKRKIDYLQASLAQALDFLAELFENNYSYSSINTARSALSTLILLDGNITFGCHPYVIRFLKGVYNLRPPVARYQKIWDVDIVLRHLRKLSPVRDLGLKKLTLKLVMLMALITAHRAQTLHLLDLNMLRKSSSGYTFTFDKVIKTSRPGQSLPVLEFKAYPKDRRLCIVTVLKEYLKRRSIVNIGGSKKLFLSFVAPHKPVVRSTISRWIKEVLAQSGIDITVYKAHSTRAAATSKAKSADIPVEDILKAAGWARAGTFAQYYNKPVVGSSSFAGAVLNL